jgi:hypothetical protein
LPLAVLFADGVVAGEVPVPNNPDGVGLFLFLVIKKVETEQQAELGQDFIHDIIRRLLSGGRPPLLRQSSALMRSTWMVPVTDVPAPVRLTPTPRAFNLLPTLLIGAKNGIPDALLNFPADTTKAECLPACSLPADGDRFR